MELRGGAFGAAWKFLSGPRNPVLIREFGSPDGCTSVRQVPKGTGSPESLTALWRFIFVRWRLTQLSVAGGFIAPESFQARVATAAEPVDPIFVGVRLVVFAVLHLSRRKLGRRHDLDLDWARQPLRLLDRRFARLGGLLLLRSISEYGGTIRAAAVAKLTAAVDRIDAVPVMLQ